MSVALSGSRTEEYTLSDTQSKGLALRVRKTSAVWCLRGRLGPKQTTWTIADAREMPDPDKARAAAGEAWNLIKRGVNPETRLKELRHGGPVVRHFDPERDGWTWEQARDAYLEHVAKDKAPKTHQDYRTFLKGRDLLPLEGLLVKQMTDQHAKGIQDDIYGRGKASQARHTLHVLKACLNWVAQRAGSGISLSPFATVRPIAASLVPSEPGYLPTEQELGKLPWRLEAANIQARSRIAGLLIWLTAQRIETVLSSRKEHFEPVGKTEGIWTIPPAHIKSKRGHAVPLGPAAWDLVKQAMALTDGPSGWLFPQVRPRRIGGAADGHLSYHPVAGPMSPLDPHDLRRGFATYGQVHLGMKPSDTKAILDHAEGNSGDVTAMRYALHDGAHFKWALMRGWENYLIGLARQHSESPGARMRTLLMPEQPPPDVA